MSAVTAEPAVFGTEIVEHRIIEQRSFKLPIILTVVSVLLVVMLLLAPRAGYAVFRLAAETDYVSIPDVRVRGLLVAWICVGAAALLLPLAWHRAVTYRKLWPWAIALFALLALTAFLAWAGAGANGFWNVTALIVNAIAVAVPLVFGALGGVIGERSGVVNIAIEAQLLMAAFTGTVTASITNNPWAGLVAALAAGALVAALLGLLAITYKVDQIIVGVVLNVLVIGMTTFLWRAWLQPNSDVLNRVDGIQFDSVGIPGLNRIPIIGPALFNQNIIVYIMFIAVVAVWFGLYRTRWGLRTRAVGEHPKAADTVGIKVNRTRWVAVLLAGAVVGIGGASYTLMAGRVTGFDQEMTSGYGFIALAAVIFGKWNPVRAAFAGLLFGFAINLRIALPALNPGGPAIPPQFLLMVPYVVTLLAVAGLIGRSRAPAAVGSAYSVE
ncbi:MAG: ABC transporter permease [Promicromonosporaceae bacterium]|nr:ABC transporter permease [Promicromonosporaceae bacterium]